MNDGSILTRRPSISVPYVLRDQFQVEESVRDISVLVVKLEELAYSEENHGVPVLRLDVPVLLLSWRKPRKL